VQFSNPIVGSAGRLVREQIVSPDYVAGVSGWRIGRDGSAEFNSATIRGVLVTGDTGAAHWEISATHADEIEGFTGDADETDPAALVVGIQNGGAGRQGVLRLRPAELDNQRVPEISMAGESPNGANGRQISAAADYIRLDASEIELSDGGNLVGPVLHFGSVPAAPSAPAYGALLYTDLSAGKVRLRVKFPTGTAVTLAVEP